MKKKKINIKQESTARRDQYVDTYGHGIDRSGMSGYAGSPYSHPDSKYAGKLGFGRLAGEIPEETVVLTVPENPGRFNSSACANCSELIEIKIEATKVKVDLK